MCLKSISQKLVTLLGVGLIVASARAEEPILREPNSNNNSNNQYSTQIRDTTSNKTQRKIPIKPEPDWSGVVALSSVRGLYDYQDGELYRGQLMVSETSYKFSKNYSATLRVAYNNIESDSSKSSFQDTIFTVFNNKRPLNEWMNFRMGVRTIIPTSKESSQNKQLIYGAGLTASITPQKGVLIPGLSYLFLMNFNGLVHEYETDKKEATVNQYTARQALEISYIYSKWYLYGVLRHNDGWAYDGSQSDNYEHAQEMGYCFTDAFSLGVGHAMSGTWFIAKEDVPNFKLSDDRQSMVYVLGAYSF